MNRPLAILALAALAAGCQPVVGPATVIDGDTIQIAGTRFRLVGIDAPELKQVCVTVDGVKWPCGMEAARALRKRTHGLPIECKRGDEDGYGRIIGLCSQAGEDLSKWLVSRGLALAYRRYSDRYVADEDRARTARIGMWSGFFDEPWRWRRGNH